MKKLLLPLLAILFLSSCEKESSTDLVTEEIIYENGSATTRSSNKRDVCHNGNIININVNAIPAHQAHGDAVDMDEDGYFDTANPCSETDCDDTDAAVNPGATEIINGIDDDCDGNEDECPTCRQTGEPDECIISDIQVLSITCLDDNNYRICFEAITQNVPPTPADLKVNIDGQLFIVGELSGLGLISSGFFACVDLPTSGQTDRNVFISVDAEGACCFCKSNFWDDPDCQELKPTNEDDLNGFNTSNENWPLNIDLD